MLTLRLVSSLTKITVIVAVAVCRMAFCLGSAVTLAWDASSDPGVVSYNVYYGMSSQAYTGVVSAGQHTSATIGNLAGNATYYFAATAIDVVGLESNFSSEVAYQTSGAKVLSINWTASPGPIAILESTNLVSWAIVTNSISQLNSLVIRQLPGAHFYKAVSVGADSPNAISLAIERP